MCVSLPAQVIRLAPDTAVVAFGKTQVEVGRRLLPEARPGDWVLVNVGQMVSRVAPEEVEAIRELLQAIMTLTREEEPAAITPGRTWG
jgi:hydrogenase assembly chaperone HypC/HupF